MPRPKVLSGPEVIRILSLFGFEIVSQRGSHIKMRRHQGGARQSLTIPNHKELDRGTALAIFRQACRYISEAELKPHFYIE